MFSVFCGVYSVKILVRLHVHVLLDHHLGHLWQQRLWLL
jgi:hypothetical protein